MTIEYVPRSRREEDGWRRPDVAEQRAYSTGAAGPVRDEVDGEQGVRVPVRPGGFRLPRTVGRPWRVIVVLVNGANLLRGLLMGSRNSSFQWSWWLSALVTLVVLAVVYRSMRLHRFSGRTASISA